MLIGTHTLLKPSTYGIAGFGIGWVLYVINPIDLFPPVPEILLICALCLSMFILSSTVFEKHYLAFRRSELEQRSNPIASGNAQGGLRLIVILAVLGLVGTAKYVQDAAAYFGSIESFVVTLMFSSSKVRSASGDLASYGIQLSYFGWIAAALAGYRSGAKGIRFGLVLLFVVILLSNVVYIDRTRPTWILFTTGLAFLYGRLERFEIRRLLLGGIGAVLAFLALFIAVGLWVGKIAIASDSYETSAISAPLQSISLYVTGGFGYLNEIVQTDRNFDYVPVRSMYPLFELMARLGLAEEPPSRILEFYYVPHPTNVGTFVEPLYQDGGLPFTLVGLAVVVFGGDWLGLLLLQSNRALAVVAWTNLCFANALSFFTPKFSSFPFWLIVGLGILAAILAPARPSLKIQITDS